MIAPASSQEFERDARSGRLLARALLSVVDGVDIDGKEWGESRFAETNRKLIVTRWLYAKVTKEPFGELQF